MAWIVEADGTGAGDEGAASAAPADLQGPRALLLARPRGVYTCARLVAGLSAARGLVAWDFHLDRLAIGLRSVDSQIPRAEIERLQRRTTRLAERVAEAADRSADLMLTALWWRKPDGERVVTVHACRMPQVGLASGAEGRQQRVNDRLWLQSKLEGGAALVYGRERTNARCKDSKWVDDRAPIEARAREVEETLGLAFQEVLLSREGQDGDRLLLEGTVSNLFVVRDGCVVTADDGVLHGSTRELVLAACRDLEIPVVFEPPRLSDHANWAAAFVTSSVRIVMKIATLVWEEGSSPPELRKFELPSTGFDIPRRIRDHILAQRMYLSAANQ